MAYSSTGFTTVSASKRGTAPSIYAYKTAESLATIRFVGYFNALANTLVVGELIYAVTSTGTTAVCSLVQVLSNASGVVDCADGTVLANTDTD